MFIGSTSFFPLPPPPFPDGRGGERETNRWWGDGHEQVGSHPIPPPSRSFPLWEEVDLFVFNDTIERDQGLRDPLP